MSIINNRHSVRKFNGKEIEKEKIIELLKAGMAAPSSKNKKPWQFIVLDDKGLIEEFSGFHKNWSIIKNADKAIIVCGDLYCDEREIHTVIACSAASQNILLKSVELNLGAVWLGSYPDNVRMDWIRYKLKLPNEVFPISLIAIGCVDEIKNKKRPIDNSKIHFNKW